jgi:ATP-dependent exoDNAse (exonuclease V) beta subunit
MIKFKADTHQYFTRDDKELISVSAFVERFEPHKDWGPIAAKWGKKNGMTKQEVLDLWERKKVKGQEAGTTLHDMRESKLLGKEYFEFGKEKLKHKSCSVENGFKWALPVSEVENGVVYPEFMIYDIEHMICGQSDKVIVENNRIHIYDYKTDKEIEFKAYSNPFQKAEKLLPPVQHLDNCNGNIYSLKMSLYMYLLCKANAGRMKPGTIILEWCPLERDEEGFPILYDGKPKVKMEKQIELPYRKKEVIDMLKTLKTN